MPPAALAKILCRWLNAARKHSMASVPKEQLGLWHRVKPQPAGPKSHALVVGVSHYEFLPPYQSNAWGLGQLDCGASAAVAFANWLKDSYRGIDAPLGSIRLLVSPSEAERRPLAESGADGQPPATAQNFLDALEAWNDECNRCPGSVALLYICGHGVLIAPDQVYVLLQDAFRNRNLDNSFSVAPTQLALGTRQLKASLLFVDACQQIPPDDQWNLSGGKTLVPPRVAFVDSRTIAPIYYASSPGSSAWGLPGEGTYFVQGLLACLRARAVRARDLTASEWTVTTGSLYEELPNAVRDLRDDQHVIPAGWGMSCAVHRLDAPPVLPFQVSADPEGLRQAAKADLLTSSGQLVRQLDFATSPLSVDTPCGEYRVHVKGDEGTGITQQTYFKIHEPPKGGRLHIDLLA
jgi:hypothetical protein